MVTSAVVTSVEQMEYSHIYWSSLSISYFLCNVIAHQLGAKFGAYKTVWKCISG